MTVHPVARQRALHRSRPRLPDAHRSRLGLATRERPSAAAPERKEEPPPPRSARRQRSRNPVHSRLPHRRSRRSLPSGSGPAVPSARPPSRGPEPPTADGSRPALKQRRSGSGHGPEARKERHVVVQGRSPEPSIPAGAELLRGAPRLRRGGRRVGVPPHRAPRPGPQRRRRGGGAPRLGGACGGRLRRRRPPPPPWWRRGRRGGREQGRGRRVRPDAPRHRRRCCRVYELRSPCRRRPLRPAPREMHGQGAESSNENYKEQYSWAHEKQQRQRCDFLLSIPHHGEP